MVRATLATFEGMRTEEAFELLYASIQKKAESYISPNLEEREANQIIQFSSLFRVIMKAKVISLRVQKICIGESILKQ